MVDSFDIINPGIFCLYQKKFHGLYALENDTIFMEIEIYDNNIDFSDKNDLLRQLINIKTK